MPELKRCEMCDGKGVIQTTGPDFEPAGELCPLCGRTLDPDEPTIKRAQAVYDRILTYEAFATRLYFKLYQNESWEDFCTAPADVSEELRLLVREITSSISNCRICNLSKHCVGCFLAPEPSRCFEGDGHPSFLLRNIHINKIKDALMSKAASGEL